MKKISIAVIVFAHLLIELSAVDADDCCFPSDVSIAAKGAKRRNEISVSSKSETPTNH
jgi:hypothetical protein